MDKKLNLKKGEWYRCKKSMTESEREGEEWALELQ